MADKLAADFAARQIASEHATLVNDAERVARDARYLADALANGTDPRPGDANALAQAALQLAQQAARLHGIRETVAYLTS